MTNVALSLIELGIDEGLFLFITVEPKSIECAKGYCRQAGSNLARQGVEVNV